VVATERYEQSYTSGTRIVPRRQVLTSDVLLTQLPDADWTVFRDVLEVDGKAVPERAARIPALLMTPSASALEQAERLAAEGARYNLVDIGTIDNPLLAMALLQERYRDRLRFEAPRRDDDAGADIWMVRFFENRRPTILRGAGNGDLSVDGRYWIEGSTGRVVRTNLNPEYLAVLTTYFRSEPVLGIDVIERMTASFLRSRVYGTATYGPFRRFGVSTSETLREP
jgi:hypothetical protein